MHKLFIREPCHCDLTVLKVSEKERTQIVQSAFMSKSGGAGGLLCARTGTMGKVDDIYLIWLQTRLNAIKVSTPSPIGRM